MKQIKQLDENVALLAGTALSFIADNTPNIFKKVAPEVQEQLQNLVHACDDTMFKYEDATDKEYVSAIISAIEQVQFAVEEYQALEREEY